jgi:uncharacterized protein YndB with AHSA1/START domain
MSAKVEMKPANDRELVICRLLDAPREKIYQAWTKPELIKQWFCPKPWTIASAVVDVRAGGSSNIVMRSPDGHEIPNPGVYLEVVPNEKLVFTNAFAKAWDPALIPNPGFKMVGTVTFEDAGNGKTKYTARVQHWSKEDCEAHAKMGFEAGWGICADQLEALVKSL